jgi:ferric-dicitrate binding protein FerR (iron transport regulator)
MHDDSAHEPVSDDTLERLLRTAGRRAAPDAQRREQARAAVRDAWRHTKAARVRRRWLRVAVPAAAAAAVVIVMVALQTRRPDTPAGAPALARVVTSTAVVRVTTASGTRVAGAGDTIAAGATVDTPADTVATFALEGGGELRQNAGSTVRWIGQRRVAIERGQIYVDSGSPRGGSLVIETFAGLVHDIGTRFDVQIRGRELRVRVRDGVVRLDTGAAAHDAAAGRELVADASAGVRTQSTTTFGAEWDWILRATPFRLEGATLEEFLTWVEIEGGRTVVFADARLRAQTGGTRLHGSIRGLSMDEALDAILPATGLTHHAAGDRIVIARAPGARP